MPIYTHRQVIPRYRLFSVLAILLVFCGCEKSTSQEVVSSSKTITGTIAIAGNILTDSDVNDINAAYASNDSLQEAQAISNPAIVGGYVNRPEAGPQGRSTQQGDVDDYYSTTLLAGQTVRLIIGNPGDPFGSAGYTPHSHFRYT